MKKLENAKEFAKKTLSSAINQLAEVGKNYQRCHGGHSIATPGIHNLEYSFCPSGKIFKKYFPERTYDYSIEGKCLGISFHISRVHFSPEDSSMKVYFTLLERSSRDPFKKGTGILKSLTERTTVKPADEFFLEYEISPYDLPTTTIHALTRYILTI